MKKTSQKARGRHTDRHAQTNTPQESGAIYKDWGGRMRVALSMPTTYFVGMSSLALQLLYRMFNAESVVVCERIFWEKGGAQAGKPLESIEGGRTPDEFDLWAFTISWEMDYFSVIEMLRQAGIPPLAADRQESRQWDGRPWPLLIAGGPGVTMNPEPMAPIFDAILIGEGEEAVPHLVDLCCTGVDDRGSTIIARCWPSWIARPVGTCPRCGHPIPTTSAFARLSGAGCAACRTSTRPARSTRPTPSSPTCT